MGSRSPRGASVAVLRAAGGRPGLRREGLALPKTCGTRQRAPGRQRERSAFSSRCDPRAEAKLVPKHQKPWKMPEAAWHCPASPTLRSCAEQGPGFRTMAELERAAKRKPTSDQTSRLQNTDTELSIKPFNSQTTHMHNVLLHSVKRKKKMRFFFFLFLIQTEFQVYIYRIFRDSYPSC